MRCSFTAEVSSLKTEVASFQDACVILSETSDRRVLIWVLSNPSIYLFINRLEAEFFPAGLASAVKSYWYHDYLDPEWFQRVPDCTNQDPS